MANPGWDLQKAAYAALIANAPLTSLLGGERVYDDVPQDAAFPYVAIDQMRLNEWSTGTERGSEHILMLHIWSRYDGKREAYEIADAIRSVLDDAELTLDDNRLINVTHQFSDLKRDTDGETYHGVMRFRAVTEPLS
ncbi:MAG: DUF3168 domain-containing protein [Rhodomicrobiaceae bacterium]